jgi:hypothetical protein
MKSLKTRVPISMAVFHLPADAAHEALVPATPKALRQAIGRIRVALPNDQSSLARSCLDRDVAIDATGKTGTESYRQTGEPAQIGCRAVFLHSPIHQDVDGLNDDQIKQTERRNDHPRGF